MQVRGSLENTGGPARSVRRMAVAAVFEKAKLEFQKIQEVAIILFRLGHGASDEQIVVRRERERRDGRYGNMGPASQSRW